MNRFLNQNYVVSDMPSFDEATLILWDDCWHNIFEMVGDHFCDNFVTNVTQGDWVESVEG